MTDLAPVFPAISTIVRRAANEGIPVGAIARMLNQPFGLIHELLKQALSLGAISGIPKNDWPGPQSSDARLPTIPISRNIDDVEFACRQYFRLTALEAGFLVVLLRYRIAEKAKLHAVIEEQRSSRPLRPDKQEVTDPKMVDVMICKLRKKMKAKGFTIETSWATGYYLDPSTKEDIYAAIGATHHAATEANGKAGEPARLAASSA